MNFHDMELRLPVIGAPMFLVSGLELVLAQCRSGIVGTFPALNARTSEILDDWLAEISETLQAEGQRSVFGVNLILHRSNDRIEQDLALLEKHKVPLIITSLGAHEEVTQAVHGWSGTVMHDVINQRFAHKAVERGADGLILVAAGAGGHAGTQSPFALMAETRAWFDGQIALAGAISSGRAIYAARVLGADFSYVGSPFIACEESLASSEYRQMIVDGSANDILYTDAFSGVHGNYLKPSIERSGLDLDTLGRNEKTGMSFASDSGGEMSTRKAWRDVWGSGQGIGSIEQVLPVAGLVDHLEKEYEAAVAGHGSEKPVIRQTPKRRNE